MSLAGPIAGAKSSNTGASPAPDGQGKGGRDDPAAGFCKPRVGAQKLMMLPTKKPWPCQVLLFLLKLP
jgi:hypothetical protein